MAEASETTLIGGGHGVQYGEEADGMESLMHEEEKVATSNIAQSSFNLANAVLGGGILSFPYAFAVTGVIGGILSTLVLLAFAYVAVIVLVHTKDVYARKTHVASYQELVKVVYGPTVETFLALCIAIYGFGGCATFLVIIGDQAVPVVEAIAQDLTGSSDQWYTDRKLVIFIFSWAMVFPLCLPKRLGVLSVTSFFAVLAVIYFTLMIVYYAFAGTTEAIMATDGSLYYQYTDSLVSEWADVWANVQPFNWSLQFFQAAPIICFAYQCHLTSIAAYNELEKPTPKRMAVVGFIALGICGVLYTSAGLFGYLTFGDDTQSDVLVNYGGLPAVQICRIGMAVVASFSYPILNFVTRLGFNDLIVRFAKAIGKEVEHPEAEKSNLRFYSITLAFFIGTLLIALFVPNVNDIISLIGSIFATMFIFIFPGAFLISIARNHLESGGKKSGYLALGVLYLVFGTLVGAISLGISLYDDITEIMDNWSSSS